MRGYIFPVTVKNGSAFENIMKVEKVIGVREGSQNQREYLVLKQGSDDSIWLPESQLSENDLAIEKYKSTVEDQLKTLLHRKNSQVPAVQDSSASLTYQHMIANEFPVLCMEQQRHDNSRVSKSSDEKHSPDQKMKEFKCTVCNFVASTLQNLKCRIAFTL